MVCHCLHICSHFLTSFRSPSCSFSGDAPTISSSQKPSSFRASNWGWNCYGSRSEGPRSRHSRRIFAPVGESIIERCPDVCATESASCCRFMFIQSFVCLIRWVCKKTIGVRRSSKIICWVDCGLWSAIWGGWAARILMPAWVHPFSAITSYPQPIYHESANHEDGWGHPYGCKAAHSGTLIVFTNLVETSWHFLFSRTWTARSASRLMLGHLAINMGFLPLLCTISTQIGNVVSHN